MKACDLFMKWLNNHKWKVDRMGLVVTSSHKDMYGHIGGLFFEDGVFIAIWTPTDLYRSFQKMKNELPDRKSFRGNISDPNFFPVLKSWLKQKRKDHRKR